MSSNPPTLNFQALRDIVAEETVFSLSSVALGLFRGRPANETYSGLCSSVAMRIGDRFFLLTAGHCVRDAEGRIVTAVISRREAHLYTPRLERRGSHYVENDLPDMGYFEVPAVHAQEMASRSVFFCSLERAQVPLGPLVGNNSGWPIIVGFPARGVQETNSGHSLIESRIPIDPGMITARFGENPTASPARFVGFWFGMQMDSFADIYADQASVSPFTIDEFGGMSGGPLWFADPQTRRMELGGTFVGHIHREERRIDIGFTPIAWHLRLIAEDYPELAETIYAAHPGVRDHVLPAIGPG